jgi:hypothetical protein
MENNKKQLLLQKIKKDYGKHPIDMSVLENNINQIFSMIESESLTKEEIEIILNRLACLSPRRTGTFLEVFNRENNNLDKPKNISHDAVASDNTLVEIKTSRVYMDTDTNGSLDNTGFYSLYNQLIDEVRIFTPFEELLEAKYDCNIQQIKTKEFDNLNYCLFFKNVIIEFSISHQEIKNETILNKIQDLYELLHTNNYNEISTKLESDITKLIYDQKVNEKKGKEKPLPWKNIQNILTKSLSTPELKEILKQTNILVDIYKLLNLKYSDKQHAGNKGEGQFHINKTNIIYHLAFHYRRSHSYNDFVNVLKNKKAEK